METTKQTTQKRAVDCFRKFLTSHLDREVSRGDTISVFEIEEAGGGHAWITARTDMVGLSETNLFRFVAAQYWFILVGPRGAITVKSAPRNFHQFDGQRVFGMHFDLRIKVAA